jgi:hypothetical protein
MHLLSGIISPPNTKNTPGTRFNKSLEIIFHILSISTACPDTQLPSGQLYVNDFTDGREAEWRI